jgi:hypothetical protein
MLLNYQRQETIFSLSECNAQRSLAIITMNNILTTLEFNVPHLLID